VLRGNRRMGYHSVRTMNALRIVRASTAGVAFALIAVFTAGCDATDCADRCVGEAEIWYDDCEACADEVLFESECAEIWCD
jgi:hypothetical protein